MDFLLEYFGIIVAAIAVILVFAFGYVKAPPDQAYLISGLRKKPRILIGKAGIKIPFFERLDKLSLGAIQIDVKTGAAVPTAEYINIRVDSTVSVKVGNTPEMVALAAQNFLNVSRQTIAEKINDLLEGNVREIVGQMKLTDMVNDRKAFSEKVQDNAVPDLARYGLELITFNVQNFSDDNEVIVNLGIDNIAQIKKDAEIARSNAEREVEIAKAENEKQANDAKIKAAEQIAIRQNDLAIKRANLQRDADTQAAIAEAAKDIEAENQRKAKDVAATNADIAKREREIELREKAVAVRKQELDADIRQKADAEKYAAEQKANADLIRRQREAEAKAYEVEQSAKALRAKAEAEKYAAEQQAEGIRAVGLAEAEAIEKKAEAQKKMGQASVLEMFFNAFPQAVSCASAPLEKVDSITMYGEGNSSKMVGDVMKTVNQVLNGFSANGINITDLLQDAFNNKNNE